MSDIEKRYQAFCEQLPESVDVEAAKARLIAQHVETPSWGYGAMGTRFYTLHKKGAPRDVFEKFEDAAQVQKYTGIARSVAIHIPWDKVDDYQRLREHAESLGVSVGAVNPNVFQEDDYVWGSLAHPKARVRQRALDHMAECVDIMNKTGSKILSLWFADGTNYPGQDDFRSRKHRMEEGLAKTYEMLGQDQRMLIEYKFFEPTFYHTDIPDWGLATLYAKKLGPKAQTLVDLGHHPQGTNIEYIIAILIDEGKLGGFHFNNRKYADDDLTTSSINPYELFLIYNEIVAAEQDPNIELDIAYMIDQCHYIKPNIEAMIQSVVNIQTAYAKALLVDRKRLQEARENQDMIDAEECLVEAFNRDVTPLLAKVREELGVPVHPLRAFRESGYMARIEEQRSGPKSPYAG